MAKEPVKKKPASKKAPAKKAPAKKSSSGTLTERMGEARNRPNKGLPARIERPRGNLNRANPPKEIRAKGQGGTSRSLTRGQPPARFKPVPLGDRPKMLSGPAARSGTGIGGAVAKGLFRTVGGPATMLVSMTTATGDGREDKPSGKLFSPSQNRAAGRGNPKTTNRYTPSRKKDIVGRNPNEGLGSSTSRMPKASMDGGSGDYRPKPKVSMDGGGVNKPVVSAKDKMKRQQQGRKPDKPKPSVSVAAPESKKTRPVVEKKVEKKYAGMTFQEATRRNMQSEYERAKRKPKGNLLGFLRSKKR
jgi:hypothetical protein